MISIIICSRTTELNVALLLNIERSIGFNYELIVIDNTYNQYSIFEAYNLGISKSNGRIWCFMHDDIIIHTQNWGQIVETIFSKHSEVGLIGVAGAKTKTKMPSSWSACNDSEKVINIIQHFKDKSIQNMNCGFESKSNQEVVVIDGVFMIGRRNEKIKFDTDLHGFHNYDLNLSFLYKKNNYKIIVTNEISIEHFSIGTINLSWYQSAISFHKKYASHFPLTVNKKLKPELKKREIINGAAFVVGLIKNNLIQKAIYYWLHLIRLKPISNYHFIILKLLVKKCLQ